MCVCVIWAQVYIKIYLKPTFIFLVLDSVKGLEPLLDFPPHVVPVKTFSR